MPYKNPEARAEFMRQYMKTWRKKHKKDPLHRESVKSSNKKWRSENKEKVNEIVRDYYERNKEEISERRRKRRAELKRSANRK